MIKKIKKIVNITLLISLVSNITVFAHTVKVKTSGESKYKAIRLTPQVYNNANTDLFDILLKDENGEIVPYFINTSYQNYSEKTENYQMNLIDSYIKDEDFYFDYKVAKDTDKDILATIIELKTDNINFAKDVEIFGSYDNVYWEKIQDDKIYNVEDNEKLEIVFNTLQKYTHYRFKLNNNLEKISFNDVTLKYNELINEKIYFEEKIRPKYTIEEKDKETLINIEGVKNLKISEIIIETDSIFKRNAEVLYNNTEIYNLSFDGTNYTNTTIPLNLQIPQEEILQVAIKNNDDKPINIKGIDIMYCADEIIFEDKDSLVYTLEFAKNDNIKAPVYDISSYKNEVLKNDIDRLDIQEVNINEAEEIKQEINYKIIFNIVIIVVGILLGILILAKLKKK